jgi:hypothetical protein
MPTRSKFTAETRAKIIQALKVGASANMAAAIAGVDEAQIRRWRAKGKESEEGTSHREFYEACKEAEAHPGLRALGIIYKELPDNPTLAWKYVERKVPGYEPPVQAPTVIAPVNLTLSFFETLPPLAEGEVVDGEVVDEQSGTSPSEPTAITAGAASKSARGR